jgi:hypothetical protein
LLSGSLLQLAGLIPIQYSINQNAQSTVEKELIVGERVFLNILEIYYLLIKFLINKIKIFYKKEI